MSEENNLPVGLREELVGLLVAGNLELAVSKPVPWEKIWVHQKHRVDMTILEPHQTVHLVGLDMRKDKWDAVQLTYVYMKALFYEYASINTVFKAISLV